MVWIPVGSSVWAGSKSLGGKPDPRGSLRDLPKLYPKRYNFVVLDVL